MSRRIGILRGATIRRFLTPCPGGMLRTTKAYCPVSTSRNLTIGLRCQPPPKTFGVYKKSDTSINPHPRRRLYPVRAARLRSHRDYKTPRNHRTARGSASTHTGGRSFWDPLSSEPVCKRHVTDGAPPYEATASLHLPILHILAPGRVITVRHATIRILEANESRIPEGEAYPCRRIIRCKPSSTTAQMLDRSRSDSSDGSTLMFCSITNVPPDPEPAPAGIGAADGPGRPRCWICFVPNLAEAPANRFS